MKILKSKKQLSFALLLLTGVFWLITPGQLGAMEKKEEKVLSDTVETLCKAIENNSFEDVKKIVGRSKILVNCQNEASYAPIYVAITKNNLAIVKYLVANGAELNSTRLGAGYCTALQWAVSRKNYDLSAIVSFLLQSNIDIDAKGLESKTALHFAATNKLEIVKLLINGHASLYETDRDGYTALHDAACAGKLDIVKYFIETLGMSPYVKTRYRWQTPLDVAKEAKKPKVVEYLSNVAPSMPYNLTRWLNNLAVSAFGAIAKINKQKTESFNKWWWAGVAAIGVTHWLETKVQINFSYGSYLRNEWLEKGLAFFSGRFTGPTVQRIGNKCASFKKISQ